MAVRRETTMAVEYGRQRSSGVDDLLSLPILVRRRNPSQELGDYPFFHEEEDRPTASWMVRHGGVCLAALGIVSAIEAVVLGMLLR
jgi:hypothetical protein